jgi:uncharacterized protein YndB with AHSA1/START domain
MLYRIQNTLVINAPPSTVWDALTQPHLMTHWMGGDTFQLHIQTNWQVNSPITITGFHHLPFENKGTVLQFDPGKILSYTHLSSLSRLPDEPGNYTIITFTLTPVGNQTSLTLTINNFPTETIYRHLDFYWRTTLILLKKFVEEGAAGI